MRVFLSWSGNPSHEVALAFNQWLPLVIQSVDPYLSSEAIEKGAPWSPELDKALTESRFGIICLTDNNQDSRWLNFEAGALARAIEQSKTRVSPFLFNLKQSDVEGPLSRLQSTRNEKKEVWKLVGSMNNAPTDEREKLKPDILERSFETYWPELEGNLNKIAREFKPKSEPSPRPQSEVLEEILDLVRALQRQAVSKDDLNQLAAKLEVLRAYADRSPQIANVFAKYAGGEVFSTVPSGYMVVPGNFIGLDGAQGLVAVEPEISEADKKKK